MADFNYSRLATKTRNLITRFGRDVTLLRTSETPADPANPQQGATATTSLTVRAVVLAGGEAEDGSLGIRRGTEGVAYVAPPSTGEDIRLYDHIDDGGVLRRITAVDRLRPASTTLLYTLTLGGAA